MKIFLAIHKIEFPSHPVRSSWTKAYNSIRLLQHDQVSASSLTSKKRKPNLSGQQIQPIPPKPTKRKPLSSRERDMRIQAIKARKQANRSKQVCSARPPPPHLLRNTPSELLVQPPNLVAQRIRKELSPSASDGPGTSKRIRPVVIPRRRSLRIQLRNESISGYSQSSPAPPPSSVNFTFTPLAILPTSRPAQSGAQDQVAALTTIDEASQSDNQATQSDHETFPSDHNRLAHSSDPEPEVPATPAHSKHHSRTSDRVRPASSFHPPSPAISSPPPSPTRSSHPSSPSSPSESSASSSSRPPSPGSSYHPSPRSSHPRSLHSEGHSHTSDPPIPASDQYEHGTAEVLVPADPAAVSAHEVPEPEIGRNNSLICESARSASGRAPEHRSRTGDIPNRGNSYARSLSGSPPLTRSKSAKRKHASGMRDWPDPLELSIAQLKEYLDQFGVLYQSNDRPPRLIAQYKLLRANCSGVFEPRAQTKRGRKSGLSSDWDAGPSDTRRWQRRHPRSAASKSDFNFVPSQAFSFPSPRSARKPPKQTPQRRSHPVAQDQIPIPPSTTSQKGGQDGPDRISPLDPIPPSDFILPQHCGMIPPSHPPTPFNFTPQPALLPAIPPPIKRKRSRFSPQPHPHPQRPRVDPAAEDLPPGCHHNLPRRRPQRHRERRVLENSYLPRPSMRDPDNHIVLEDSYQPRPSIRDPDNNFHDPNDQPNDCQSGSRDRHELSRPFVQLRSDSPIGPRNIDSWRHSLSANQPQPDGALLASLQSFARDSRGQGTQILVDLNRIATDVSLMRQMATSNINNQAGPSRRQAPNPPRDNTLMARIRFHVQALIGQVEVPGKLPRPSTASEKASWNRQTSPSGDSEDNYSFDSDIEDPCFPFPSGPGHLNASSQTLSIMWGTMRKVGIKSFRPDWTKPFNEPNNKFLWDLAFSLFLKLVEAGEYSDIDLEMTSEQKIHSALRNHVTNLVKKYRRQENWTPEQSSSCASQRRRATRRTNRSAARVGCVLGRPALTGLISIIEKCTSDDESVYEDNSDNEEEKKFEVLHMPWRHPRILRMMKLIDRLIEIQKEARPAAVGGPRPTERLRPRHPNDSHINCQHGLPADCYHDDWVRCQTVPHVSALSIQPGPSLEPMETILKSLVR